MRILWLTNISMSKSNENRIASGSWLQNLRTLIFLQPNVEMSFTYPENQDQGNCDENCFSFNPNSKEKKEYFKGLIEQLDIGLVHIHGTEFDHSLEMTRACKEMNIPFVVSIQGLVSIIKNHLSADLPYRVIHGKTIRNVIMKDGVSGLQKSFAKRGIAEIKTIQNSKYIIGRTTWDRGMVSNINSDAVYYHCNEILRADFYELPKWDYREMKEHSIFVSQGSYSLKGFHYVLQALKIIIEKYPNTKLIVSGKNVLQTETIKDKLKQTYYGKYIKKYIKVNQLEQYIEFTGNLNAREMKNQFLKANVFVSASTMENESNSVSEAKILGVPVIASYVGGVIDRIIHNEDGYLYQHNSPEMLAYYVKELFGDVKKAKRFSDNGKKRANEIFDSNKNIETLMNIYTDILSS